MTWRIEHTEDILESREADETVSKLFNVIEWRRQKNKKLLRVIY